VAIAFDWKSEDTANAGYLGQADVAELGKAPSGVKSLTTGCGSMSRPCFRR